MGEVNQDTILQHQRKRRRTQNKISCRKFCSNTSSYYSYSNICNIK